MNRSRIAHILAGMIGTLAVLLGSFFSAAPAQAVSLTGTPGQVEFQLLCQDGKITISPFMSVQNGYFNGQYMVYRYHLTNGTGWPGTSGWSGPKLMEYMPLVNPWTNTYVYYGTTLHTNAVYFAPRGQSWGAQIQIGYWNPNTRSYSYSGWYQPTQVTTLTARYSAQGGPLTRCYT